MNKHAINEKCKLLKLPALAESLEQQERLPQCEQLSFNKRLEELLDAQLQCNIQKRIVKWHS